MSIWPFKRSRADQDAKRLLQTVTAVSRRPALYGEDRAPDTLEGRFEVMALNAGLALLRLNGEPGAESLAQAFTDKLFRQFDSGLREAAVGDTAVPKRMHKMAGAFYGRLKAYSVAAQGEDREALRRVIGRNVLGDEDHPFAAPMAVAAFATVRSLGNATLDALFDERNWLCV